MSKHQQALELAEQGLNYTEIARQTGSTWARIRSWVDPDGDWRVEPKPKRCTLCLEVKEPDEMATDSMAPDGLKGRCKACQTVYNRAYTRSTDPVDTTEDKKYARTVLPENRFICPECKTFRHSNDDHAEDYGHPFESQEEANQCCEGLEEPENKCVGRMPRFGASSDTGGYPYGLPTKYKGYGMISQKVSRFVPTLHYSAGDRP